MKLNLKNQLRFCEACSQRNNEKSLVQFLQELVNRRKAQYETQIRAVEKMQQDPDRFLALGEAFSANAASYRALSVSLQEQHQLDLEDTKRLTHAYLKQLYYQCAKVDYEYFQQVQRSQNCKLQQVVDDSNARSRAESLALTQRNHRLNTELMRSALNI